MSSKNLPGESAASMIQFLMTGSILGVFFILALFADSLGFSKSTLSWVMGVSTFTYWLSSMFFGRLSDVFGRRRLVISGLILGGIGYLSLLGISSMWSFLLLMAFSRCTRGMAFPVLTAWVSDAGYRMGRFQSFGSLGAVFFLVACTLIFYGQSYDDPHQGMVGIHIKTELFHPIFVFAALTSALCVGLLTRVPVAPQTFLKKASIFPWKVLKRSWVVIFAMAARQSAAAAGWVIYGLAIRDLGVLEGSSATTIMANVCLVHSANMVAQWFFMYWLGDRFKPYPTLVTGMLLSATAFGGLAMAESIKELVICQLFLGVAWAFLYTGGLRLCLVLNPEERGSVSGLVASVFALGGTIGPIALALLVDDHSQALSQFGIAMGLSSAITVVGLLLLFFLLPAQAKGLSEQDMPAN